MRLTASRVAAGSEASTSSSHLHMSLISRRRSTRPSSEVANVMASSVKPRTGPLPHSIVQMSGRWTSNFARADATSAAFQRCVNIAGEPSDVLPRGLPLLGGTSLVASEPIPQLGAYQGRVEPDAEHHLTASDEGRARLRQRWILGALPPQHGHHGLLLLAWRAAEAVGTERASAVRVVAVRVAVAGAVRESIAMVAAAR
eukprot:7382074-Prymnesium_polylepis.2